MGEAREVEVEGVSEVFTKRFRAYAEGSCVRIAPIWDSCGRCELQIELSGPEEVEEVVGELRELMLKALRQAAKEVRKA